MHHVADLIAPLRLPAVACASAPAWRSALVDDALLESLAAGLPAGHVHVWGGPSGAGKTAFLLALLAGAASQGRRVLYASYDLPVETLALRLLAMAASVDARALSEGTLGPAEAERASRVRAALESVPFHLLAARGLSVASLEDRLVRMPFRAEVLAVDFLQAVVREVHTDAGRALRDLSDVATRLHVAVVCAVRADDGVEPAAAASRLGDVSVEAADRVGWIAPAAGPLTRRAEVLRNRYGERPALPLTLDPSSGALHGTE
jgi:archaellum biogenesis ATPase FlaH